MALPRQCACYSRRTRTCAHEHACAADYVLGTAKTNACPAGSAKITDVPTCQAAAAALVMTYAGSVSYSTSPSGCYLYLSAVRLNADPAGAAASGQQPLCTGTGAPFQPPPPHTYGVHRWVESPHEAPR